MPLPVSVTVTVAASPAGAIEDVADALRDAGLDVGRVLGSIGVITGTADEAALDAIGDVPGVVAVERSGTVQLPPPDADVQ